MNIRLPRRFIRADFDSFAAKGRQQGRFGLVLSAYGDGGGKTGRLGGYSGRR